MRTGTKYDRVLKAIVTKFENVKSYITNTRTTWFILVCFFYLLLNTKQECMGPCM